MDAYPGLTNVVGGFGTDDYGVAHADELIRRYQAEEAVFEHKALLISVNRTAEEWPLYDATRCAWKIDPRKAKGAEVILATQRGVIIGAFVAEKWLPATVENFPRLREDVPGRVGFVGHKAPADIRDRYRWKRVPEKYRRRGSANPIRYTWRA